jgi:hypothetical protein
MATRAVLAVLAASLGLTTKVVMNIVKTTNGDAIGVKVDIYGNRATSEAYTIADDAGKVKLYKNMDDVFKDLAKAKVLNQVGSVVEFTFNNIDLLEPKAFTGDYTKKAAALKVTYTARKAAANIRKDALDAQIALMPSVTASEQALKTERENQRAVVVALIAWLTAEIETIDAILGN